ncbi:hypothetical protein B566_EDAN015519 [Ephemera danica]|nr:hypothetical protein B566_EDAN015519 [Ephemera danica]
MQNLQYQQASTSHEGHITGSTEMEDYSEPFEEVICEVDQNMDICLCHCHHDEPEKVESSCQTDITGECQSKEDTEKQVELLKTQVSQLNQVLASMQLELRETKDKVHDLVLFTHEKLKQPASEPMLKYYTGLPNYELLKFVFNFVTKEAPGDTHRNCLLPLQECVMFLMRLRLNVTTTDLGFRFNVSISTACRMFHKWLDMMYTNLKPVLGNIPNDSVLTGMGFNVAENLGYINATLILPSISNKKQKQPEELIHSELAKESSKLRIQVEKVIGHVKQKYKILNGPVTAELLGKDKSDIPFLDKIITVAYVLTNLNETIVSQL